MKIVQYVKKSKDQYQLILDNGEVIDTYEDVILHNQLLYHKEIDSVKYNKIISDNEIQKNYNDCLRYIQSRLRSQKEIEEYLKRKKVHEDQIPIIVHRLIEHDFINDERYCRCFINDKLKFSSQGEYRIISDLRKNGIDEEMIFRCYGLFDKKILESKMEKLIDKYVWSCFEK